MTGAPPPPGPVPRLDARLRAGPHVFVGDLAAPVLDPDDDHHLRRVLRLRPGSALTASDGRGRWRPVRLGAGADLEPDGEVALEPLPEPALTVGVVVPKGDRPEWLVQKLTELGIDRIVLLTSARAVVRWEGERAERHLARLQRVAREAAMQSRRCHLPRVEGVVPATALGAEPGTAIADPDGHAVSTATTTILIGPEGGWSPEERAELPAAVCLAPGVLRTETAAVAAATVLVSLRSGLLAPSAGAAP